MPVKKVKEILIFLKKQEMQRPNCRKEMQITRRHGIKWLMFLLKR